MQFNFKTDEDRVARIKAAGHAEGISASEWLRRVSDRALSGDGDAGEAARLRVRVANLELERDFFRSKVSAKLKAFNRELLSKAHALAAELDREYHGPVMRGPEPDDDE